MKAKATSKDQISAKLPQLAAYVQQQLEDLTGEKLPLLIVVHEGETMQYISNLSLEGVSTMLEKTAARVRKQLSGEASQPEISIVERLQ